MLTLFITVNCIYKLSLKNPYLSHQYNIDTKILTFIFQWLINVSLLLKLMTNLSFFVSTPPLIILGKNVHPDTQRREVTFFLFTGIVKEFACRPFLVLSQLVSMDS